MGELNNMQLAIIDRYFSFSFSQGSSCQLVSATGPPEREMVWKSGQLTLPSEQNLVDCSRSQGNEGCNGGRMDYALQYVKDNGDPDSELFYSYHVR